MENRVTDEKLTKCAIWKAVDEEVLEDLRRLSEKFLCDVTVNQTKKDKSYKQKHLSRDGKYDFNIRKEDRSFCFGISVLLFL